MNLIDFDNKRLVWEKHRLKLVGVVNTVVQVGTWHWRENRERVGQVLGAWQKALLRYSVQCFCLHSKDLTKLVPGDYALVC